MRLNTVIRANALFSLVSGTVAIAGAGPIAERFGIATGWVMGVGVGLVPFALGLAALARRRSVPRAAVVSVVIADLSWVAGAIGLIALPNAIASYGKVLLGGLTAVVAVLAWLQWSAIGETT